MSTLPSPSLLDETLRAVARRYRVPPMPAATPAMQESDPATALAIAIEQARVALLGGAAPDAAVKRLFVESLARLIREAMRAPQGDPVFQAMALRHRAPRVREHASLSAHAGQDRRAVHTAINGIAHPGKQQRLPPGPQREALAQLHAAAGSASWSALAAIARHVLALPETGHDAPVRRGLTQLLDDPGLARLQRLDALASDELVQQYQSLWDRNGPRPGSPAAAAQGSASRRRGAAVEALAAQALEALARRLGAETGAPYRVATSMRVPASMPGSAERAKTEWDAALLRQAPIADATPAWDVCLLVEAKASVDAATTDLARLLRGLRLLAQADASVAYPFECGQGTLRLTGASLSALTTDEAGLARTVLYCCDAPAEPAPRLLGAAGRMQLLSAQASLEFAARLADGQAVEAQDLEPLWHELLTSRQWGAVLNQYPMLRQVRDLMVHTDDLLAAVNGPPPSSCPSPENAARCALE
ncbi:3-deoxy-D-arabino-heptulosonate 7-phosphate synthase [Achromobacter sp. NPDC058515]|uniref:3-deoxy-D-arabino-heptulosonate 7-phosphate synthase n=1 Tax=Achromobacter sp. NPDC058515 TaxID=3346533 RepID=UPI0036548F1E